MKIEVYESYIFFCCIETFNDKRNHIAEDRVIMIVIIVPCVCVCVC